MDYSRLAPMPENPLDRLAYFNSLKDLINAEKDKIRAWHQNGAGGREVIQVHTRLMDEVILYLVDSLVALDKYADASPLKELTVIAVGGYGRGELNPCSDIDLLFFRPKNIKAFHRRFYSGPDVRALGHRPGYRPKRSHYGGLPFFGETGPDDQNFDDRDPVPDRQ